MEITAKHYELELKNPPDFIYNEAVFKFYLGQPCSPEIDIHDVPQIMFRASIYPRGGSGTESIDVNLYINIQHEGIIAIDAGEDYYKAYGEVLAAMEKHLDKWFESNHARCYLRPRAEDTVWYMGEEKEQWVRYPHMTSSEISKRAMVSLMADVLERCKRIVDAESSIIVAETDDDILVLLKIRSVADYIVEMRLSDVVPAPTYDGLVGKCGFFGKRGHFKIYRNYDHHMVPFTNIKEFLWLGVLESAINDTYAEIYADVFNVKPLNFIIHGDYT